MRAFSYYKIKQDMVDSRENNIYHRLIIHDEIMCVGLSLQCRQHHSILPTYFYYYNYTKYRFNYKIFSIGPDIDGIFISYWNASIKKSDDIHRFWTVYTYTYRIFVMRKVEKTSAKQPRVRSVIWISVFSYTYIPKRRSRGII